MTPELRVVTPDDPEYPDRLVPLEDPPERLWVAGRNLRSLPACVAIVGTRHPTPYGLDVARGLARDLAVEGYCIVSGMALGCDAAAHDGALAAGGVTVAVLAGGADLPYPRSNARLYRRILESGGSIVSEQRPGTSTHRGLFDARNRIIAGMSVAVVVVQARTESGTSSTVRHAHRYQREVFAVPGDIRSPLSAKPHELIREGAAWLLHSAEDVRARLEPNTQRSGIAVDEPVPDWLEGDAAIVLGATTPEPLPCDDIVARAALPAADVLTALGRLELLGLVRRGPSGTYFRAR